MTSSEILVQQEVGQGMFREYKTVKPLGSICVSSPDLWVPACLILFAPHAAVGSRMCFPALVLPLNLL